MAIELLAHSFPLSLFIIKDLICLSLAVLSIFSFRISSSDLLRLILIFTFRSRWFFSSSLFFFLLFCLFYSFMYSSQFKSHSIVIGAFLLCYIISFIPKCLCLCVCVGAVLSPILFSFYCHDFLITQHKFEKKKKSLRLRRNEIFSL